jgi:hypothetical protein
MANKAIPNGGMAVAVVTALLSLAMVSATQAQQGADASVQPNRHVAKHIARPQRQTFQQRDWQQRDWQQREWQQREWQQQARQDQAPNQTWRLVRIYPGINYDAAPGQPVCTSYTRMMPPCMSTWPAGDPNYHGTMRGDQYE